MENKKENKMQFKIGERNARGEILNYGPSKTDKSQKNMCDINNIVKRYNKTGVLQHLMERQPQYGDFSQPVEFAEALNTINRAYTQFETLPAKIRAKYNNDPAQFLNAVHDPQQKEELINLGVFKKEDKKPLESQGSTNTNEPLANDGSKK